MCLSIIFIILDVLAVTSVLDLGGLNPFWKIAFVFKCFTDTIILDDFKTALDKLSQYRQKKIRASFSFSDPDNGALDSHSARQSVQVNENGELRMSSGVSPDISTGMQSIDVDKIEPLATTLSPRSTFSGPRKSSKEWWEHESYA